MHGWDCVRRPADKPPPHPGHAFAGCFVGPSPPYALNDPSACGNAPARPGLQQRGDCDGKQSRAARARRLCLEQCGLLSMAQNHWRWLQEPRLTPSPPWPRAPAHRSRTRCRRRKAVGRPCLPPDARLRVATCPCRPTLCAGSAWLRGSSLGHRQEHCSPISGAIRARLSPLRHHRGAQMVPTMP